MSCPSWHIIPVRWSWGSVVLPNHGQWAGWGSSAIKPTFLPSNQLSCHQTNFPVTTGSPARVKTRSQGGSQPGTSLQLPAGSWLNKGRLGFTSHFKPTCLQADSQHYYPNINNIQHFHFAHWKPRVVMHRDPTGMVSAPFTVGRVLLWDFSPCMVPRHSSFPLIWPQTWTYWKDSSFPWFISPAQVLLLFGVMQGVSLRSNYAGTSYK